MKTIHHVLALATLFAIADANAQAVVLGTYQATGSAENFSVSGGSNSGASASYDATVATRNDGGIFSFTNGGSGGVTFTTVGETLNYTFTYSGITMVNNLTTPAFRTGFDFGSTAFVYHMTSTGSQPNLDFYANTNGNPFSLGAQVGTTVSDWSPFANQNIRFATGNTINATVSLQLDAINGDSTYDYTYTVTYEGGGDSNTASQAFTGVAGNNIVSIFHGANSSGVNVDGNAWTVSNASMELVPEPSTNMLLGLAGLAGAAALVARKRHRSSRHGA